MMKLITEELLDTVTSQAKENSRLRMNYNFHASMDAPIHRLLNALEPGTYLPPHRHTDKEETYLVLRGSLLAFFYDDAGNVTDKYNPQIQISAESETKRSIFREKDKTKRSKKESAQHSKSRNKSFVMTSVSAL